jgi:PTS system mannose-specific IIA component
MLIRAAGTRGKMPLNELAPSLEDFGKKSISLASAILKGNKRG